MLQGFDARFPNQNQTKHCWQNFIDYHKCINARGEDFKPCRQVSRKRIRHKHERPELTQECSSTSPTDHFVRQDGSTDGTIRSRLEISLAGLRIRSAVSIV